MVSGCPVQTEKLPGILQRHETPKSDAIIGVATRKVC